MYQQIHHQGSRCINKYIARGGIVLENASSPLRNITKYIHFCLFNKVNVINNNITVDYETNTDAIMYPFLYFLFTKMQSES